jgi:L-fucose isomerase-like protein
MIAPLGRAEADNRAYDWRRSLITGEPVKIAFVTCLHPFYDLPSVTKHRDMAINDLRRLGCAVVSSEIPRTSLDATDVAASVKNGEVDIVVLFFCTWVAEDITLSLARGLMDIPMLIWALPYLDRDIPMPSPITGLAATGSNLRRLGKPFAYMIGHVTAERLRQVVRAAKVAAVVRRLRRARFGLIGNACPGMVDVQVDEAALEKALGVTAVHFELDTLIEAAAIAPPSEVAGAAERLILATGGLADLSEETLAENLQLYVGMKELIGKNRLDAYCVRCWPELRDQHKITPCATHALMAQEGIPSTCEIDLMALITTYILSRLACASAFNFDITGYLEEEGAIQFCHCGAADPSLAEHPKRAYLRRHMRTGTGATVEFPFKEGPVTLAKLLRPLNGKLRLFVASGHVIPSADDVRGSVATVRPEPSAPAFMDAIIREAVEHHLALVYGDWRRDLEQFCTFTGIEYVPVTGQRRPRESFSEFPDDPD